MRKAHIQGNPFTDKTTSENADEDEKKGNVLEVFYTVFAEERRGAVVAS
jgi:hypothetical protein